MQDSGRHNFPRLRLARLDEIELEEQTIDRDCMFTDYATYL